MLNVIMSVYNNIEVAQRSIEALISHTDVPHKIILVNNHSFDDRTQNYLQTLLDLQNEICVVDPGKNIGCHWGWNFGFEHIAQDYPFTCKVDDDTVVSHGWASSLINAHKVWWKHKKKAIGILGANLNCRTENIGEIINLESFLFEIPPSIVSFSCVMFLTDLIRKIGPMKGMQYRTALGKVINSDNGENLYGGEEVYYLNVVRSLDYDSFWLHNVVVEHIDSSQKNWTYLLWKFAYGYLGLTRKNFEQFVGDEILMQKSWLQLIRSRILNPECSWYGKDVDEVVRAFQSAAINHNWPFQDLLKQISEYYR